MSSNTITDEVLASFLQCKYKAWLRSTNKTGVLTDFEQFEKQRVDEARTTHRHRLMNDYDAGKVVQHSQLTSGTVPKDTCFISPSFVIGDYRTIIDPLPRLGITVALRHGITRATKQNSSRQQEASHSHVSLQRR